VMLTLETVITKFWSSRRVLVMLSGDKNHIDVVGFIVTIFALLDQ
jgi:hypothetical protein